MLGETNFYFVRLLSVQSLSCVQLFATPWTAVCQVSLFITTSQSLLKLMSIELVMPSNHLILSCLLLLPPSIFPSIRVFLDESVFCIRWPKYQSFSFSISPSNECSGLIPFKQREQYIKQNSTQFQVLFARFFPLSRSIFTLIEQSPHVRFFDHKQ